MSGPGPTACPGVNKAWILRSTRAFSRRPGGSCGPGACPRCSLLSRAPAPRAPPRAAPPVPRPACTACQIPRVSARPPRPVPRSNPAGPPLGSGCPAPRRDWRAPPRVNGVTPLPHSPPTQSSAPRCWPEVRRWGSARVRERCVTETESPGRRVPRATRSDRPVARGPWSLGGASPGSAPEPGLAWLADGCVD